MKPFSHWVQLYGKLWSLMWVVSWLGSSKTFSHLEHLSSFSVKLLFTGLVIRNLLSTPDSSLFFCPFLFFKLLCLELSSCFSLLLPMTFFLVSLHVLKVFLMALTDVRCASWMCSCTFFLVPCVNEHWGQTNEQEAWPGEHMNQSS